MITIKEAQADKSLMNKFIEENIGLVSAAIRRLGLQINDDLYQEGCMGLIRAAELYNPGMNTAFSTYAIPTIQGFVLRYKRDFECENFAMHASRDIKELFYKSSKLKDKGLTDIEICKKLRIPQKKLAEARNAMSGVLFLDAFIADDSNATFADIIRSDFSLEDNVIDKIYKESIISELLSILSEKQKKVFKFYLKGLNQSQIAKIMNCSQVTISKCIKSIIKCGKLINEKSKNDNLQNSKNIEKEVLEQVC